MEANSVWAVSVLPSPGHVGAPLPCNSVKLVDVAEMNYLAANGVGEVGGSLALPLVPSGAV
jgi:hypothetical protein